MNTKDLKNIAEAIPFYCIVYLVRLLPRTTALKMGRFFGRISRYFLPKRRATTFDNLRRAYPEHDAAWVKQQVRQVFEQLGISGVEMLRIDRLNSQAQIDKYFTFEGLEHLDKLQAKKTGAFILTAHIGSWESGTAAIPILGYPVDYITKTIRNPYVDRFFHQQRESAGGHCLDSKKGARKIIRSLANSRFICVLLDQHISKKHAVIVNFFGRPAYATPIIPQIALKTRTPVIPIFIYRNPDFTYRMVIEPAIVFNDDITPEVIQHCTQQLTDIIEAAVRKQPDQWFWVHRRWRKSAERK